MHHKRRRPKNRRAGCLLCKPHKANGQKGRWESLPVSVRRQIGSARATEIEDAVAPRAR